MTKREKSKEIISNLESLENSIECAEEELIKLIELIKNYNTEVSEEC